MSHNTPPEGPDEDRFAELFGNLPDPRQRDAGEREPEPEPPLSRREARQRAAASSPGPGADEGAPEPVAAPRADAPRITREPALAPAAAGHAAAGGGSTMTLDALFADETQATPTRAEKKRNRRVGGWIALGVVVLVVGGIVGTGAWAWAAYEDQIRAVFGWQEPIDYEPGMATGEALVTIVDGDTGATISDTLYEAGVTMTPEAFYSHILTLDAVPTFYPGVFQLQQQMTSAAALEALQNPDNRMENSAQLREGLTVEQTLPLLADGIGLPIEELQAAVSDPAPYGVPADTLEGWLFPATYQFSPGVTAPEVIQTLVDRTIQSLDSAGVPVEERERILTIASIIEREARFEDDFYRVSRVIYNRLSPDNQETNGLLQMDSTAQYGYGEMHDGTVSSTAEALEDDNPWNTYVNTGLPIGPIANPGDTAIDAAMNPADGPWLYFVTVNLDTGETVFTETNAQHQQAVTQWQQWCRDNPDSGC
ncbi:endolytic transglycosylase MltG [Microbacterium sp. NPDC078428]|uniref:endolytic transglycosylase MltG n=1 Tax=Microbacterium sp. NPDC078428 TaxID=3364190 RepID=UPI0037CC3B84